VSEWGGWSNKKGLVAKKVDQTKFWSNKKVVGHVKK
jgi:hypothetical protein